MWSSYSRDVHQKGSTLHTVLHIFLKRTLVYIWNWALRQHSEVQTTLVTSTPWFVSNKQLHCQLEITLRRFLEKASCHKKTTIAEFIPHLQNPSPSWLRLLNMEETSSLFPGLHRRVYIFSSIKKSALDQNILLVVTNGNLDSNMQRSYYHTIHSTIWSNRSMTILYISQYDETTVW